MKKILRHFLYITALIITFTVTDKVDAAEIVKQSGNVFGTPQVVGNGVKVSISGTVRFIRHTKFSNPEFSITVGTKQLRATTRFTATQYNCAGYYMTRAYSDTNGSSLVGYAYVHITKQDIKNPKCTDIKATDPPEKPNEPINATHPIVTVREKSKMIQPNTTVSPSQPKTISNPETIKESDKTVVNEPTPEEMNDFFEKSANYDVCLDSTSKVSPQYMSKDGGLTYECVDMSNCMYTALADWYCNTSAKKFSKSEQPTGTTIHYDIPEYSNYRTVECEDNSTEDQCNYMDEIDMNDKLPTGQMENNNTPVEQEPEQEPEIPLNINACKGDYDTYGVLFDGNYQMPWGLSQSDVQAFGMGASINYNNQLNIILGSGTGSLKVGDSNTLTNSDFLGAAPCPKPPEEEPEQPQELDGLSIYACRIDGTTNQYEMSMIFSPFGNEKTSLTGVQNWIDYPEGNQAVIQKGNDGKTVLTVMDDNADFSLYGFNSYRGDSEYFYSNRLTASQIKKSEICTTTGTITTPGETNDSEKSEELPSCYCPNLDNFGAGLGFMCCVWDCPGLDGIIEDGKQFLSEDLVGTATAPPVPDFDPPPMPNIFDVLNGVETKNQPDPPKGENAPGLEDAGFTADDLNDAAPDIEFREDTTGGFNIIDPIGNLPADGSTAPRPKESTAEKPQYSGSGSGKIDDNVSYPKTKGNTVTPPKTSGTATPPDVNKEISYPSIGE